MSPSAAAPTLLFAGGGGLFISHRSHILSSLIALEFMALSIYLALSLPAGADPEGGPLALPYLALAACEGALGLGLLTTYSASVGTDKLALPTHLQW